MIVQVGSLGFHLTVEGNKWEPHPRLHSYQKRKKASFWALSCESDRMPGRVCTRVKHVCVCACWCVYTFDTIRCPQSLPILFIEAGSLAALKLVDSSNLVT